MKTMFVLLGVTFAATTFSASAAAWDGPTHWYESATGGPGGADGPGGGGILGTGGAGDHNITCAHCHIKGAKDYGTIDFKPTFNPPIGATYKLGQTYEVTMTMTGEHLGLSGCMPEMKNVNAWAASFEDDSGKVAGSVSAEFGSNDACPPTVSKDYKGKTLMYNDCHAIVGRAEDGTTTSWTFQWTAPSVSTPVTLNYAGVDSDCEMNSLGDDVKVGTLKLGGGLAMRSLPRSNNIALAYVGLFPAIGVAAAFRARAKRRKER